MKQLNILHEVMIMRPIVIFLLVFMHSFTMFTGGAWKLPEGIHNVVAYDWLTKLTFSFLLETFIFISGYLLRSQFERRIQSLIEFITNKAKRLLLPSLLFSILYFLTFMDYHGLYKCLLSIIEGAGHLWYLPMSFWCFIGGYLLYKLNILTWLKFLICFVLACCSGCLFFLPLRLNYAAYYLLFFYLGMMVYEKRHVLKNINHWQIVLLCVVYISAFALLRPLMMDICNIEGGVIFKLFRILMIPFCKFIYSTLGLLSFYTVVTFFLRKTPSFTSPSWLIYMNSISFGVYVYHQFMLKLLYYHTMLPMLVGSYALPWIGFVLALAISILLSGVSIRTKFGKYLIG